MDNLRDSIIRDREKIYCEIVRTLTEYENEKDLVDEKDLYRLLVKIQNRWDDVITAEVY